MSDQSPMSSVRALSRRVVQPDTCRATYPSPLPSESSPAAAGSTECSWTSTSQKPPQRVAVCCSAELDAELAARDGALDPGHHVERRADHRLVVAVGDHLGHQREDRRQRRLDPVLATHVVGALRLHARRRPAQDQRGAGPVEPVGQVGGAARELADVRGPVEPVAPVLDRVLAQPLRDGRRRRRRPRRGPAPPRRVMRSSCSRAAWCRIWTSYAARSSRLRSYAARAAGSGRISSSPRSSPVEHRGRDLVRAERRGLDQPADHRAERGVLARIRSTSPVRK